MSGTDSRRIDDGQGEIFPCPQCGADLVFLPGGDALVCLHCSTRKEIVLDPEAEIVEQDFHELLNQLKAQQQAEHLPAEHQEVRCDGCGANVAFLGTLTSTRCAYCGTPLQRAKIHQGGTRIHVEAIIPFQVHEEKARQIFRHWVTSRWFAPNRFKHAGDDGRFQGSYLPYWTFDAMTSSRYQGERGRHYYVTVGTGKNQSRQRRTSWTSVSGLVDRFFDDTLVLAAKGLPSELIDALPPWNLSQAVPFSPAFLAGIASRTYDVELEDGFGLAKLQMEAAIRNLCLREIGGDEQRVHQVRTHYDAITCKHLLLPIWILAYQFHGQNYQVAINAVTGKIAGNRPYSVWKISAAILCGLLIALGAYLISQR